MGLLPEHAAPDDAAALASRLHSSRCLLCMKARSRSWSASASACLRRDKASGGSRSYVSEASVNCATCGGQRAGLSASRRCSCHVPLMRTVQSFCGTDCKAAGLTAPCCACAALYSRGRCAHVTTGQQPSALHLQRKAFRNHLTAATKAVEEVASKGGGVSAGARLPGWPWQQVRPGTLFVICPVAAVCPVAAAARERFVP